MFLIANPHGIFASINLKHKSNFEYKTDVTECPYQYIYIYLGIRGVPPIFVDEGLQALTEGERAQLDKYYTPKKFLQRSIESLTEEDKAKIDKLMNKIAYNACNLHIVKERELTKKRFNIFELLLGMGYNNTLIKELVCRLDEKSLNTLNKVGNKCLAITNKARVANSNLILKCEFYTRIRNLKNFLQYLGFSDEVFNRFIEMINDETSDFNLFDYFDPQTFDLNEKFYYDLEVLDKIKEQLDNFMLLYLYRLNKKVNSQTKIINTDNTYYEFLTNEMRKVEELREENLLTSRNIPCIYSKKEKNHYILFACILSRYSFEGVTEILLYSRLFKDAIKEYNKNKARNRKKLYE